MVNGAFNTVRTVVELQGRLNLWRNAGETIALVPTMGSLHEGHLSLMRLARSKCDRVLATIFVNPMQFSPAEDFESYPRNENEDVKKLIANKVDMLFAPAINEMYPEGSATSVSVSELADCLCGISRPGFFDGVATIVAKLLIQTTPNIAIFGEKDYQQLKIIQRLVKDLNIPTKVLGAPTIREPDGLALSSRNGYLDATARNNAPNLHKALVMAAASISAGENLDLTIIAARNHLMKSGFRKIDYLDLRDAETLQEATNLKRPVRIFAAAWLNETRLIDNIAIQSCD